MPEIKHSTMTADPQPASRATSIEGIDTLLDAIFIDAAWQHGSKFQPLPSDILISPMGKSGTTWMQQITHGLRTRGDMEFAEITEATPWIDIALDMGWDLSAPQAAEPRLFKSHRNWYEIPKGGRYIVSFRHPYDVAVSLYRFFEGWLFVPGTVSLEALTRHRWQRSRAAEEGYCAHLISWWEQRHNENVLLLCYEDMKADLPAAVRAMARFMEIDLDDDLLKIVLRQSSRDFMLAHRDQFDDHLIRRRAAALLGLPLDGGSSKVTLGDTENARYQLSPAVKQHIDFIWREQVQANFGFPSYSDLRRELKLLRNGRR